MKFRRVSLATALVAAAWLAGCASTRVGEPAAGSATAGTASSQQSAQSQVTTVDAGSPNASSLAAAEQGLAPVIYFDFDSSLIRPEYHGTIDGYAKLLRNDRQRRLTIEGHADERGSHEYNLALGQRRAEAVRKALQLLAVNDDQLEAISYGEERPAVQGTGEEVWSKNRRAEFRLQ